jgi:hypothetical protein
LTPPPVPAPGPALKHGAYSENMVGDVARGIVPMVDRLCEGTPAADHRFEAARVILATKLARLELVGEYLDKRGGSPVGGRGQIIKAAQLEMQLMASVEKSLSDLGLTPAAAAKLGVDLARSHSIVEELGQARDARDRAERRLTAKKTAGENAQTEEDPEVAVD